MKIIGATENGFILEATKGEVAQLNGMDSEYTEGFYKVGKVGAPVPVTIIHKKAYCLTAAARNMKHISESLKNLAEDLRPLDVLLAATVKGGGEE